MTSAGWTIQRTFDSTARWMGQTVIEVTGEGGNNSQKNVTVKTLSRNQYLVLV